MNLLNILLLILGLVIGVCIILPFTLKKYNLSQKEKEEYNNYLEQLKNSIQQTEDCYCKLQNDVKQLSSNKDQITKERDILLARKEEILQSIVECEQSAKIAADSAYNLAFAQMEDKLNSSAEQLSDSFFKKEEEYKQEYLNTLADYIKEFNDKKEKLILEYNKIQEKIKIERSKAEAAIAANEREAEKQLALNRYKIILNQADLKEIELLREIIPHMRNSRSICKIIWESYFRTPTNELVNRVVGTGTHCGIYRITNLLDGRSYIGQSVDLAERIKQHVKCGLGIDAPNNKLYTAMQEQGVQNFTFEVLEECSRKELNEREIYWIDYYKTQIFGYNMNRGGA